MPPYKTDLMIWGDTMYKELKMKWNEESLSIARKRNDKQAGRGEEIYRQSSAWYEFKG